MFARIGAAGVALVAVWSCRVDVDYSGTQFRCDVSPECPPGTECVGGLCQPIGPAGDSGSGGLPDARPRFDASPPVDAAPPDAMVTAVSVRVSAGDDDAEEYVSCDDPTACAVPEVAAFLVGTVNRSSTDLEFTSVLVDVNVDVGGVLTEFLDVPVTQVVGMRFAGVNVPVGSTITEAWVQFTVDETDTEETTLHFHGQAADNPPPFGTDPDAVPPVTVTTRPLTTASVDWSPAAWNTVGQAGADQRTPDLKEIIQEIVDRGGWAEGNAIVLIIDGTGKRVADSFNGGAATAPLLYVDYE